MGGTRRGQRWCKVGASSCAAKKGDGESDERGANAGTSGGTNKQILGRSRVHIGTVDLISGQLVIPVSIVFRYCIYLKFVHAVV
jgi:hypothetical protein